MSLSDRLNALIAQQTSGEGPTIIIVEPTDEEFDERPVGMVLAVHTGRGSGLIFTFHVSKNEVSASVEGFADDLEAGVQAIPLDSTIQITPGG